MKNDKKNLLCILFPLNKDLRKFEENKFLLIITILTKL